MHHRTAYIAVLILSFCLLSMGCATSDGSGGGWVVVGQPEPAPPPTPQAPPRENQGPGYATKNKGMKKASENHLRSAYRFLAKGKPDHALKELEKARRKTEGDFWFHYYAGGAYFYKGMYEKASDSWQLAYRYTQSRDLRSRSRTCQSFAFYQLEGKDRSTEFLLQAIDIDEDNHTAREILREFGDSGSRRVENKPEVQVGFMGKSDGGGKKDRRDEREGNRHEDDEDGDDRKGKKHKKNKKRKRTEKIRDMDFFREYFLIEMPKGR